MAILFLLLVFGVVIWSLLNSNKKNSRKLQQNKPRNQYKRIPIEPPRRGVSDVTATALQVGKQNGQKGPSDDIPVIEEKNIGLDELWELHKGRTSGEVDAILMPQTLVDGKQTWEYAETDAKHDLPTMLRCCEAELERMRSAGGIPAPFYFRRVAILFRKEKDYQKEIEIIEFYWRALEEFYEKTGGSKRQVEALKKDMEHRYEKAKQLLEKQHSKTKKSKKSKD